MRSIVHQGSWLVMTFAAVALVWIGGGRALAIDIVREPVLAPVVPAPAQPQPATRRAPPKAVEAPAPLLKAAAPKAPGVRPPEGSAPKPAPSAPLTSSAPRLSVGDTWQYLRTANDRGDLVGTDFRQTIAAVSDREIVFANGYRMTPALASLNFIQNDKEARTLRPFGMSLRFPMAEGKAWTEVYESLTTDAEPRVTASISAKSKVLRQEQIAVAAGTFQTWVVEQFQEITLASGARESVQRTVWYSPQVKTFVQTRFQRKNASGKVLDAWTNELKSYSVAQ